MTNERPRLNHQASASAAVSAAYGPAVRRPISVAGSGLPTQTRSAAAARIPPGTHSGRSALSCSSTQSVGSEADVGELAALRALADMLGERLALERLDRAVLALDARDGERLAAGEGDIGQVDALRQSEELHADAAVRTHRYFLERENEQPGIRRQRRHHVSFARRRRPRLRAFAHREEILALAGLGFQVAELADEAESRGAVHQQALIAIAARHPDDRVRGGIHQRIHRRAVAAAARDIGRRDGERLARAGEHDHRVGGLALERLRSGIAFLERERRKIQAMPGARADPALAGKNDRQRLLDHRALHLRPLGGLDERAALIAVLLRVVGELLDDQLPQLLLVAQQALQRLAVGFERFLLVGELDAVEPGELAEAQVDDVFGLALGELVFLAQRLLGRGLVLARPDDLDHVVDLGVGEETALDDLEALL